MLFISLLNYYWELAFLILRKYITPTIFLKTNSKKMFWKQNLFSHNIEITTYDMSWDLFLTNFLYSEMKKRIKRDYVYSGPKYCCYENALTFMNSAAFNILTTGMKFTKKFHFNSFDLWSSNFNYFRLKNLVTNWNNKTTASNCWSPYRISWTRELGRSFVTNIPGVGTPARCHSLCMDNQDCLFW
jgi:hypothetical protein